jgi:hypothetical protein
MHNQRPLFLLVIIAYMLSPSIVDWATSPQPIWYKPYILWGAVVLVAYLVQHHKKSS